MPPVKLSKFCELRPDHVKLVGSTPLETCFCLYHSNFIMCCSAINRFMPEFPKYGATLDNLLLCKDPRKSCWMRNCVKCSDTKVQQTIDDIVKRSGNDLKATVKWDQWKKIKETKRFQKIVETGTFVDLKNYFMSILTEFLKHSYTKRCQAESFEADNLEVRRSNGGVALVQIDFAEGSGRDSGGTLEPAHGLMFYVNYYSCFVSF